MHTHTHNVTFYIKFGKYSKARVVRILRDFSFFFFCFFSGKRKIHICWLHVHIVLFCVYAKNMKQLFRRKNLSGFCFVKRKATTEILYVKFTFCKWRVFAFFQIVERACKVATTEFMLFSFLLHEIINSGFALPFAMHTIHMYMFWKFSTHILDNSSKYVACTMYIWYSLNHSPFSLDYLH